MSESNSTATVSEARTWLQANGHGVGARGNLPAAAVEAFTAATGKTVVSKASAEA